MPARRLPFAREGWGFILGPLVVAAGLAWSGWGTAGILVGALGGFMTFFFRDPDRTPPVMAGAFLAPADGRVVEIRERVEDPFVGPARQISVFLSPLDVHVNRAPIGGLVIAVEHRRGAFLPAYRAEAAERNERTTVAIQGETARVAVRQVAGALARRVVCRVRPGDKLAAGERFGMIRFGSRTDLRIPASATVSVCVGDHVRAGETIVGVLE